MSNNQVPHDSDKFNRNAVNRATRRVWLRRAPKIFIFTVLLVVSALSFFRYLSNIPRERFAHGYTYLERVWLGAEKVVRMTALKMSAHHEDLKNTELPVVELYVRGKRLDRLKDALPTTNVKSEKAKIRLGDERYSGKVRFKGDSMNHWAFPNKSWRVELEDGDFYRGMQTFNLNVPRVDNQIANWLGYNLAGEVEGLLSPFAENVHFRLNRLFDGIRLFLEQPNQDMLARRYLPAGKIFVGDISSEQVYGAIPRKKLYSDLTAWSVDGPGNDLHRGELELLINTLHEDENPYLFYDRLTSIVDVEALAKFMALLELVGSVHVDETHNGKLYFHPHIGKFIPIVWDTVAYMWGDEFDLDIGVNKLFRSMIQNPAFRDLKDRFLWKFIEEALPSEKILSKIDLEMSRIRRDLYASPYKLKANDKGIRHLSNREVEEAVSRLRKNVVARENRIRNRMGATEVEYRIVNGERSDERIVLLRINSAAGFEFERFRISFANQPSQSPVVTRVGLEGLGDHLSLKGALIDNSPILGKQVRDQVYDVSVSDRLLSKRRYVGAKSAEVVPAIYRYKISNIPENARPVIEVIGKNAITGIKASGYSTDSIPLDAGNRRYSVWWTPNKFRTGESRKLSGRVRLTETLQLTPYDSLYVAPGTEILLEKGVSILLDGASVHFDGTAEQPIVMRAAEEGVRWGTLALRNVENGSFSHVIFEDSSFLLHDYVRYEGAFAVHGGAVEMDHISVRGNYPSVKSGRLTLRSSKIESPFPFSVKSEHGVVREIETVHEQIPSLHSHSIVDQMALGTAPRAEREFKFSLQMPWQESPKLMKVASKIRKALERRSHDKTVWQAPQYLDSEYYVDSKAEEFLYRDIYFDTPELLAYKNQISYRLRNRFKDRKSYKEHVKRQDWVALWPYRLEFQAKVNRRELGNGFSTVDEARFEFRDVSAPFSVKNQPPDRPWDLDEFIPYFQSGNFQGMDTYPAYKVMQALEGQYEGESLSVIPKLVLITERYRQHLNIPSEFGSGPNPEQAFIISLDKSDIYDAKGYLEFLKSKREGLKYFGKPQFYGSLLEIEIEFERNVSDVLDQRVEEAKTLAKSEEVKRLEEVRDAFLSDQQAIMQVVDEELIQEGIEVIPASKSKYVQMVELSQSGQ